jgi:peptidoglycan/xylan/chitin deacetylase (PgdA/CDA1 family)
VKTHVVLTVDVEPSIAGAIHHPLTDHPLIHEPVWGEVDGQSEALGFILRVLKRYDLMATFFVETLHVRYFSPAPMGEYVSRLLDAGQDVQLHVHPVWRNFDGPIIRAQSPHHDCCGALPVSEILELVQYGREQIKGWTGKMPVAFRAGGFSTSSHVYAALREARITYSSNICMGVNPPRERELALNGGARNFDGIIEFPVTCFADHGVVGWGKPRPLQVAACAFDEMRALLSELHRDGGKLAVIVTHPFEFLKQDDYRFTNLRRNTVVQRRFERLARFLAENTDRFITTSLPIAAGALEIPLTSPQINGSRLRSFVRAAQNAINDRLL